MSVTALFRIAAILGFAGVALGAFGAHGLKETLEGLGHTETWRTAAFYHLIHTVVLLVLAKSTPVPRFAPIFFLAGILIFSGSLYLLSVTGVRWLGALTPIGGICLLAAWLALAFKR